MVTIQDNGLQVGHKTTQEMHIALISTQDQPILLNACDENVEFAEIITIRVYLIVNFHKKCNDFSTLEIDTRFLPQITNII